MQGKKTNQRRRKNAMCWAICQKKKKLEKKKKKGIGT